MSQEKSRYPVDVQAPAVEAYEKILEWLFERGYDRDDPNFKGTALRAAKGFAQLALDPKVIESEIDAMLEKVFPSKYDGMILCKHNIGFGQCPHHLLPVIYRVSVAYIPGEQEESRVLGISKLSRLTWLLVRQPKLQEDITLQLAEVLYERIKSRGSAVYMEGLHLCMAARGIESPEARVSTSKMTGAFLDQQATRSEFMNAILNNAPPLLP